MNLLLLTDEDFLPDGTVRLTGARAARARDALQAAAGEQIRVGRLDGRVGLARATGASSDELRLQVALSAEPPARPGVDLLLAMPRPKALKRILSSSASLGVDRIFLLNAARVEKSYFDSKVLEASFCRKLLTEGIEQAQDTKLPTVLLRDRFKPFVEDELDQLIGPHVRRVLADPSGGAPGLLVPGEGRRTAVAIGPERGWVPFELEQLTARGFRAISFGQRTLRVEVFVPFVIGWLEAQRPAPAP